MKIFSNKILHPIILLFPLFTLLLVSCTNYSGKNTVPSELVKLSKDKKWQLIKDDTDGSIYELFLDGTEKILLNRKSFNFNDITYPSFSPQKDRIAFLADFSTLCISTSRTQIIRSITIPFKPIRGISWSPVNNDILILAGNTDTCECNPIESGYNLFLMDLDTSTSMTTISENVSDIYPSSWSPDGSKIVIQKVVPDLWSRSTSTKGDITGGSKIRDVPDLIMILDIKTRKMEFISEGSDPSWSPVDDVIAFRSENKFYIQDLNTHHNTFLMKDSYRWNSVSGPLIWSPDGKYILFYVYDGFLGYFYTTYIMNLKSKEIYRVNPEPFDVRKFCWK